MLGFFFLFLLNLGGDEALLFVEFEALLAGEAGGISVVDVAAGDGDLLVDAVEAHILVLLLALLAKAIVLSHLLATG